jgi:hypothetical protein
VVAIGLPTRRRFSAEYTRASYPCGIGCSQTA